MVLLFSNIMYSTCQALSDNNKQINYFVGGGYFNKLSWENVEIFFNINTDSIKGPPLQ